jgi:hypothetical protein
MGWGQMPENSKMGLLLSKAKRTYKDATTKGLVIITNNSLNDM